MKKVLAVITVVAVLSFGALAFAHGTGGGFGWGGHMGGQGMMGPGGPPPMPPMDRTGAMPNQPPPPMGPPAGGGMGMMGPMMMLAGVTDPIAFAATGSGRTVKIELVVPRQLIDMGVMMAGAMGVYFFAASQWNAGAADIDACHDANEHASSDRPEHGHRNLFVNRDGETGLLARQKDSQDLADQIIRLLSDENLRKKVIKNGHNLISTKFSWDVVTDRFIEIYRDTLRDI